MKYVQSFSEFKILNEGAIPVYPPGNPYKPEKSIQWPGIEKHLKEWISEGQSFVLVADVNYDMYTTDTRFRSKVNDTWNNKDLPLFTTKYPRYQEVDFDLIEIEPNTTGNDPRAVWLKIHDKNGVEFKIHPFMILDIQKGASVKHGIYAGDVYLIKDMRAVITNFRHNEVELKLQDDTKQSIPIDEWKKMGYTKIEEAKRNKGRKLNEDTEFDDKIGY